MGPSNCGGCQRNILCHWKKAEHWVVSDEKQVVCVANDCGTFVTGLAVMFSMCFVLNLKYQPEASKVVASCVM